MVLVQFEVVFLLLVGIGLYWFGLVWRSVCKKEKILGFQRKCCQNFVKTPVLVLAID